MSSSKKSLLAFITLVILGVTFLFAISSSAQTTPAKTFDKVLKDTVILKVSYKLYLGPRGGRYILRTSKSGNVYKQYIKK